MRNSIYALFALVLVNCASTAHKRAPSAVGDLAASTEEDPFLGCRVNTLDFGGRVLNSVPFTLSARTDDGLTYDAALSKTHLVRLRHNLGRPLRAPRAGEVYQYGPIYFAVIDDSGGGSYAMSTRSYEDDGTSLDPRRASPVSAIFERVIDPGGRLTGGHSLGGGGSQESSEAAMAKLGKLLGDGVWFDANIQQQRVQIVVCGSLS